MELLPELPRQYNAVELQKILNDFVQRAVGDNVPDSSGISSTGIGVKKLTGTTSDTEGGTTNISHGLTYTKIISATCTVYCSAFSGIVFPHHDSSWAAGYEYNFYIGSGNITVDLHATNSENILSKPITVIIIYEK